MRCEAVGSCVLNPNASNAVFTAGSDLKDKVLVRGAMISELEVNLRPDFITSPDERFRLHKTDPVTSLGFVPVPFEHNLEEPREGKM